MGGALADDDVADDDVADRDDPTGDAALATTRGEHDPGAGDGTGDGSGILADEVDGGDDEADEGSGAGAGGAPVTPLSTDRPGSDDDRAPGAVLWGLGAGLGATALALVGRGGGASSASGQDRPDDDGTSVGTPSTPSDPDAGHQPSVPPPHAGRLQLHLHDDTGASALDRITASGALGLAVRGQEAGTQVRYQWSSDGGATWQACADQLQGLPDGTHLLRAVVSNAGGETPTAPVAVTVDSTAPLAGQLQLTGTAGGPAGGSVGPITGPVTSPIAASIGGVVNSVIGQDSFQLSVAGQEPGTTLRYEISTDGGRTWFPTSADQHQLPDGDYLFRGVVTDLAGNQSLTAAQAVTVDTQPPEALGLQIRKVGEPGWDALGPLSGTGDIDLVLALPPGITALYQQSSDGGRTWAPVDAAVRGLVSGTYVFRAILQDAAGHQTVLAEVPLTVDTSPPHTFGLNALVGQGYGNAASGYTSLDGSFQLGLSAAPVGVGIEYEWRREGTTDWKTCFADVRGALDGRYEIRVVSVNAAGNRSPSNVILMEVDTRQPDAGSITLANFDDTGAHGLDRITADTRFDLVHLPSGPAGSVQSVSWEISTNGGGTWRTTSAAQTDLQDGRYFYRAVVTDAQGNTHITRTVDVTIDGRGPKAPVLSLLDFDDTGASATDGISQDGTFSLSVTGVPVDVDYRLEVSVDGGLHWMRTGAQQNLASGHYQFRAVCIDLAGNYGASQTVSVTVDREAPAAGRLQLLDFDDTGLVGDRITSDTAFTLSADGLEPGTTVRYWHSGDAGLTWTLTSASQSALADGQHWYRTEVTDLAGNTRTGPPLVVTVDTQVPDPGHVELQAQGSGLDLRWVGVEPAASVRFEVSTDGGQLWLPVLAHTDALELGDYLFRATVADAAGNTVTTAPVAWQATDAAMTWAALQGDSGPLPPSLGLFPAPVL